MPAGCHTHVLPFLHAQAMVLPPGASPTCILRGGAHIPAAAAAGNAMHLRLLGSFLLLAALSRPPPAALCLVAVPAVVTTQQVEHLLSCFLLLQLVLNGSGRGRRCAAATAPPACRLAMLAGRAGRSCCRMGAGCHWPASGAQQ